MAARASLEHIGKQLAADAPEGFARDRSVAICICREVLCLASDSALRWALLDLIEDRLGLNEETIRAAIQYGAEQGWLVLEGEPAHSVLLCDAATSILEQTPDSREWRPNPDTRTGDFTSLQ